MRDVADFYKALADETRVQILWLLMNQDELCVCEFTELLGITQSKASRHLRSLYHAGLVADRREGLWMYYSLRPLDESPFASHLAALRQTLTETEQAGELLRRARSWLARQDKGNRCG